MATGAGGRVRPATADDVPAVSRLLEGAKLPTAEVVRWIEHFVIAELNGDLVGVAGLEVHEDDGVLRSVCVGEEARGLGLGSRLTQQVIASARDGDLKSLYLLTTTAENYFPRFGFCRISRSEASPAVKASIEFREACPDSAVAMRLDLTVGQHASTASMVR